MMNNSIRYQAQQQSAFTIPPRTFIANPACGVMACVFGHGLARTIAGQARGVVVPAGKLSEDLFGYIRRTRGAFDPVFYRQLLGAGNEFKEGDHSQGIAAADATSRENARALLAVTRIGDLNARPVFDDALLEYINQAPDSGITQDLADWSLDTLRNFLIESSKDDIIGVAPGVPSDILACVLKLMSNGELIVVWHGRVCVGYRIAECLYGALTDNGPRRTILHIIGEQPGSGHHAFSVYMTSSPASTSAKEGFTDHNITKVVSGIADTALTPAQAATDTVRIVRQQAPLPSQ